MNVEANIATTGLPRLENVRMLIVQDRASVVRDTRRNSPWLLLAFALIVLWLLASAGVSVLGKLPYVTPGYTPVAGEAITFLRSVPGQNLDYPTALYSTAINMTTVGFGDIYPLSGAGPLLAVLNAFAGLTLFAFLTAILVMALQPSSEVGHQPLDPTVIQAVIDAAFQDAVRQVDVGTQRAFKLLHEAVDRFRCDPPAARTMQPAAGDSIELLP